MTQYDVTTVQGIIDRAVDFTERRIPPRFRGVDVTDAAVASWCDRWCAGQTRDSLLILGVTGSGKTHNAYGALRRLARAGVVTQWDAVTGPDLHARLRPRDGADPETELERLLRVPLLMIDDLGAGKPSEWTEEITYRLVNGRYDAWLPCLITSNILPEQFRERLGDRVASRLREMCERVTLRSGDLRTAPR